MQLPVTLLGRQQVELWEISGVSFWRVCTSNYCISVLNAHVKKAIQGTTAIALKELSENKVD